MRKTFYVDLSGFIDWTKISSALKEMGWRQVESDPIALMVTFDAKVAADFSKDGGGRVLLIYDKVKPTLPPKSKPEMIHFVQDNEAAVASAIQALTQLANAVPQKKTEQPADQKPAEMQAVTAD